MPLIEAVTIELGAAIAQSIVKLWIKDSAFLTWMRRSEIKRSKWTRGPFLGVLPPDSIVPFLFLSWPA